MNLQSIGRYYIGYINENNLKLKQNSDKKYTNSIRSFKHLQLQPQLAQMQYDELRLTSFMDSSAQHKTFTHAEELCESFKRSILKRKKLQEHRDAIKAHLI